MDDNKKFWDRTAKLYGPLQEKSNKKLYEKVIEKSIPYVEGKDCLEIACGTGQLSFELSKFANSFEATDFSEKMIGEAEKKPCDTVHFSVENARSLSFKDNSFDVFIMANILHIVPQPEGILDEARRVLKENGALIVPNFVYEGKVNKFRMMLTNMVGFKTFNHWTSDEIKVFIESKGFKLLEKELIPGDPLPEVFLAFRKI